MACRVQRVDFELPARGDDTFDLPLVAAVLTLTASSSMGGQHEVSFRPSECSDFLVPRRKVMQVCMYHYVWRENISVPFYPVQPTACSRYGIRRWPPETPTKCSSKGVSTLLCFFKRMLVGGGG